MCAGAAKPAGRAGISRVFFYREAATTAMRSDCRYNGNRAGHDRVNAVNAVNAVSAVNGTETPHTPRRS